MHFCNWCDKIRELKRRRKNTKNKYGQTCWGNGSTNELIFSMVSLVFSFIVSFIHGLILILFVRYFEPVHYSNYISFARLISIRKTHGDDVCAMSIFIQFFVFFFRSFIVYFETVAKSSLDIFFFISLRFYWECEYSWCYSR